MDTVQRAGQTYVKATVAELVALWGHSPDEWGWAADTPRERVLWLHVERDALHIETERTEKDRYGFLTDTDGAGRARLMHVDRWTVREMDEAPEDVFLELYSEAQSEADVMRQRVVANGTDMGIYKGKDEKAILDAYAQDAGYEDFADLLEQVPDASPDDVELKDVKLSVEYGTWRSLWNRDAEYDMDDAKQWLDLETGDVLMIGGIAGDGIPEGASEEIEQNPARYLKIPKLSHGDHHDIFRDWLDTLPERHRDACNERSIGHTIKETLYENLEKSEADKLRGQWGAFHDRALQERAKEWCKKRGVRLSIEEMV